MKCPCRYLLVKERCPLYKKLKTLAYRIMSKLLAELVKIPWTMCPNCKFFSCHLLSIYILIVHNREHPHFLPCFPLVPLPGMSLPPLTKYTCVKNKRRHHCLQGSLFMKTQKEAVFILSILISPKYISAAVHIALIVSFQPGCFIFGIDSQKMCRHHSCTSRRA